MNTGEGSTPTTSRTGSSSAIARETAPRTTADLQHPSAVGWREVGEVVLQHRPLLRVRRPQLEHFGELLLDGDVCLFDRHIDVRHDVTLARRSLPCQPCEPRLVAADGPVARALLREQLGRRACPARPRGPRRGRRCHPRRPRSPARTGTCRGTGRHRRRRRGRRPTRRRRWPGAERSGRHRTPVELVEPPAGASGAVMRLSTRTDFLTSRALARRTSPSRSRTPSRTTLRPGFSPSLRAFLCSLGTGPEPSWWAGRRAARAARPQPGRAPR